MWHTFNWNIWVPNVNIIMDVHCTAKLPTCYMARPRCPVCGHSSQRIYNCQSCLQSGSSLSCLAPPTEAGTWAITFLPLMSSPCSAVSRLLALAILVLTLHTVRRQPGHVTQKPPPPPPPARNWGQLKPSNRNGIILLIQSVTRVLSLWTLHTRKLCTQMNCYLHLILYLLTTQFKTMTLTFSRTC